ncbi:MAG: extracellular solute-binding protein, partial [Micromonosporaceae bacterium]
EVRTRKVEAHLLPEEVAHAAAAGNPPDIAEYYSLSTQTALDTRASNGEPLFIPAQRAIAGRTKILDEPVIIDEIIPTVRQHYSIGGELVSMPTFVSTNILFANKAMLTRAGIEQMPATWHELTTACAAITALPDGPTHAVSWPNYGWLFHMEIAGQGGLLSNNGNGRTGRSTRVFLDSPEMLNYVHWWKQMHDNGYYLATEDLHYVTVMQAFLRQEIAFVVTTTAVAQVATTMAPQAGIELMVGQLPRHHHDSSPGGVLGGGSFFLTANQPPHKRDAALAYLQHQLNPHHAITRMHNHPNPLTSLPITQTAYHHAMTPTWTPPLPGNHTATHQLTTAHQSPAAAGPALGNLSNINDAITQAMHDVLLDHAEPAHRFHTATQQAQAALDRHNAAALNYPPQTPTELRAG